VRSTETVRNWTFVEPATERKNVRCTQVPRFYMHICNGTGFVEDKEGVELVDADEARRRATMSASDVMTADIRDGRLDLTSFIEVENEAHELLFTLNFADAVTVTHQHKPKGG
jgi:hypothetical protein